MRPMRPSSRPASLALQCFIALLVVALVRPPVAQASVPELLTEVSLAAGAPRIAVVVVSQDLRASQQQGALEGSAEAALERAARFSVISVHDAFNPTAAKKQDDRLEESREKMKLGRQALDDLDNVKATEAFTQALEALQDTDLSRNFPAMLEAWTMKAAGHATGGENGPAKKDIEAVVALSPKAEFTPTFFPPDLIKFAEAQRKFTANAKGELLVRTEPTGARVWVDGTYRGVSPVTVAGLTGAKHFISASEGGYALGQSQAAPGEAVITLAPAELGPGWKKATSDTKKDPEGSTRDAAAQTLGKAARLDQVLLVLSKKSLAGDKLDLIGLRLEVRDGHNATYRTGTVNAGDPEQLTAFFDGLTGKDAKREGKDPVHHFKGGGSSPIKMIAGISLVGLAAVGVGVGVTFGVLANDQARIFANTPQTMTSVSNQARTNGQTYAVVADVSYIVGILAGAGGAVLLLTNNGAGPAEEAPATEGKKARPEDLKRRELDRKAAEDRRAAEERAKEDERRRDEERAREEDKKKDSSAEKKRVEDEEAQAKEEEARKKKEEEEKSNRKLSKKEQAALEKKKREEDRQAAEEKKRAEEEDRKKADEKKNGKLTKKQQKEEDDRKKKEEEAAAKAEEEARLKAEADAKKKKEDDERRKREEEKKKKTEDHDDLRNY